MSKFARVVVVALTAAVAVGCDRLAKNADREAKNADSGKPAVTVGVVDFVILQNAIGVAPKVRSYMEEARADLNGKFNEAAQSRQEKLQDFNRELNILVKSIPEALRDDPKALQKNDEKKFKEVQAVVQKVREQEQEIQNLRVAFQEQMNKYQQRLEEKWQATLQPALAEVGRQKGLKVILPKNGVAWVAGDNDVTAFLQEYLTAHKPEPLEPPPKAWDLPK